MRYDILLFDADNTLLDFDRTEAFALEKLLGSYGLAFTQELLALYHHTNEALWRALERGEITQDQLLSTRFGRFFSQLGLSLDGVEAEGRYRDYLGQGAFTMEGALEVCRVLSRSAALYVLTNGISGTQRNRLAGAGLGEYVSGLFISGEMGTQKPHKDYFDQVFAAIRPGDLSRVLMIGDSLTSDIQGGVAAGVDTCWYNPQAKPNPTSLCPAWEIRHLHQLPSLVAGDPVPAR